MSPGRSKSPSLDKPTGFANSVPSRKRKGGFRKFYHQKPDKFRFPASKSQPESAWPMGDGFSDAEAAPNFFFLMTGKHKHKRPRLPHTVGQLSVEAEKVRRDSTFGLPYLSQSRGLQGKSHYIGVKELWPTRENFADSSAVMAPRVVATGAHNHNQPSPLPSPKSTQETKQAAPKMRLASDFENFGLSKRISHGDRGEYTFSSFTGLLKESEHRPGRDEEEYGLNGQAEYEADDGLEYMPATRYSSEESNNSSQGPSECGSDDHSAMSCILGS